jgi:hypothetical protein
VENCALIHFDKSKLGYIWKYNHSIEILERNKKQGRKRKKFVSFNSYMDRAIVN